MPAQFRIARTDGSNRKQSPGIKHVLRHVGFWLIFIIIYSIRVPGVQNRVVDALGETLCFMPVIIATTYVITNILFRKLFFRQKFAAFSALLPASLLIAAGLSGLVWECIVRPFFYPQLHAPVRLFEPATFIESCVSLAFIFGFTATALLMSDWYAGEKLKEEILKEKAEAELRALRSQINPHFLFNVLNNLYGTILKERNGDALSMLLNISSILDFMLHEAAGPFIPVDREIEIIRKYIEIEKIRYGERLSLSVQTESDFNTRMVPPLLLFPFVENSFKHGTSESLDRPWINLLIRQEGESLFMKLENSKGVNMSPPDRRMGIGISNVRRRLELLYGDSFMLEVTDGTSSYSVTLRIATRDYTLDENPLPARR